MTTSELEVELPRDRFAPSIARHRLADWLAGTLDPADLDRARLLASELVTNAVVHGRGSIVLRAALADRRLVVEVIDQGDGFERTIRQHGPEQVGGNGLNIVETEASRWGVHEGTTHVWFELERSGPRLGAHENPLND